MMVMASGLRNVKICAGPCSFFSDCDGEGLCDLCDSCPLKSCSQHEDGCLVHSLQRRER